MPTKCSQINPQEYPMRPGCSTLSSQAALNNADSAAEAKDALSTYAIKSLKANNDLLEAQRELADTLKKLLEKYNIEW